jgi:hypothetical protein
VEDQSARPLAKKTATALPLLWWPTRLTLLFVLTGVLLGIIGNWVGWQLGLALLFWHETWWRQLLAGVGTGLFLVNAGTTAFLLASRGGWESAAEGRGSRFLTPGAVDKAHVEYLQKTSLPLTLVAVALVLRAPDTIPWGSRLAFPAGAVVGFVLTAYVQLRARTWVLGALEGTGPMSSVLRFLDHLVSRAEREMTRQGRPKLSRAEQTMDRVAAIFIMGEFLFFLFCWAVAATPYCGIVPAGFVIAIAFSLAVSAYGAVRWWCAGFATTALFAAFAVWVLLAALPGYRHTLRDFEAAYHDPKPITWGDRIAPASANLLAPAEVLANWKTRVPSVAGQPRLVIVAVDGGGIRAATWAVSLLTAVEKDVPEFPHHLKVITGASGGMVGAAYYVASLMPPVPGQVPVHQTVSGAHLGREEMLAAISADSLEPAVRKLIFGDLFPLPFRAWGDRGYALEREWEKRTEVLAATFADLSPGEKEGWRPSLVVSPVIVEDGRRLLISNLDLEPLTKPGHGDSVSALELRRMIPGADRLRLSTAVRMSASFPYVTPAVELPTIPLRRVVDAGYYDEHGVDLAMRWILHNEAALRAVASQIALIEIPDQPIRPRTFPDPCPPAWWSRGLADLVTPPQGVLSSKDAATNFRNDDLIAQVRSHLNQDKPFFEMFHFVPYAETPLPACFPAATREDWLSCADVYCKALDRERPLPLSWHMTRHDRGRLEKAPYEHRNNCSQREAFASWFYGRRVTLRCDAP